jgi:uncharacterized protein YbjT (DUF2867 family)
MYLITGVSGNTGAAAATALLEKSQPVRVLVRSDEKGRPWRDKGAEVAVASLDDAAGLSARSPRPHVDRLRGPQPAFSGGHV